MEPGPPSLVVARGLARDREHVCPPYKKLKIGHAEIDKLQAQRDEQQVLLSRQTREVNLLKTDPAYLETIARDRLDLMKEGETISESNRLRPSGQAQRFRAAVML